MTEENTQETTSTPKVVSAPTEETVNNNLFGKNFIWPIIIAIALTAVFPALALTGFTPVSFINSTTTASLIALIGGAIGGALSDSSRKFSIKGLVLGATYCISALWAVILYTQARNTIVRLEMVIPLLLAGVPTAVLYAILNKMMGKNDKPSS